MKSPYRSLKKNVMVLFAKNDDLETRTILELSFIDIVLEKIQKKEKEDKIKDNLEVFLNVQ